MSQGYRAKALNDCRSGVRKQAQTSMMTSGVADRGIDKLAAHDHLLPTAGQGAAR